MADEDAWYTRCERLLPSQRRSTARGRLRLHWGGIAPQIRSKRDRPERCPQRLPHVPFQFSQLALPGRPRRALPFSRNPHSSRKLDTWPNDIN